MKQPKIIIYQVLPRLFGNDNCARIPNGSLAENGCGKFQDFTSEILDKIKDFGITHIWYTGVIEQATQTDYSAYGISPNHPSTVKGKAGSPYAIKDYYDVSPDLAILVPERMKEFTALVKRTHQANLKVLLDFVPNHVCREYHSDAKPQKVADLGEKDDPSLAFSGKNNFYYLPGSTLGGPIDWDGYVESPAKATGNNRFDAFPTSNDWYETIKLNYGVDYFEGGKRHFYPIPSTWIKMRDILLFWARKGVDGFRCDMAEMVPVEFWGWVIPLVKEKYPHLLFIAEVYNPWEYRNYLFQGKFDYLYDKVGLYDTLIAILKKNESATAITRCWQNLGDIQSHMLHFLENHDEQRLASDFIVSNGSMAIPAMLVTACIDTCPTMIYFGQELGERAMDAEGFSGRDGRTTIFDYWSVDTIVRWRNQNRYNEQLLTEKEKSLRQFYELLFHICQEEQAISEGQFFDLMYVNHYSENFNPHNQYAFLRKTEHELLLIVSNFDTAHVHLAVNIPQHAFDYLQIPIIERTEGVDLLTNQSLHCSLIPTSPIHLNIKGTYGCILKIKF